MQTETEKSFLIKAVNALEREVLVVSSECIILAANSHCLQVRGKEIVGKRCHQVLFSLPEACIDCPIDAHLSEAANSGAGKNSVEALSKGVSCHPIYENGNLDAVVIIDFDLPRLGALEDGLRRSNAFFRNLLQSALDGIIASDMTGKILVFNDAAAEISGYSVKEAIESLDIRDFYPDDGAREVMRRLRSEDYGGKGKLQKFHVDVLGKNGDRIPISLYASTVYEGEREVATIGFFHDLRQRIKIKKELEKTQAQLMQSDKMASLGKLAAGVAHQLNNPLGGITLFTKLLLEEYELEDGARQDLNRILKDAERCRDTVKELLEFARQTRREMRPQDINRAIARTMFLLENQALFQNIEIVKDLDPSLPQVHADIQQINHLFMNLILNAAQAMQGHGRLILKTYSLPESQSIGIDISDTGPGIPDKVLPHIFEPFFTTKEEGEGTGLGLSMAYGIVENHGGRITAKSTSEGTTFTIVLSIGSREDKGGASESK